MTQRNLKVLIGLLLASAPVASAQTLLDTSAAVSVQNTLNGVGTPNYDACKLAPQYCVGGQAPAQSTASQAAGTPPQAAATTPTPAAAPTPQGAPLPPPAPLTEAQLATLGQAQRALGGGQLAQARTLFERLIAQNYRQAEPHFGLGLTLLSQKDLKGAIFEFTQLTALAPERPEGPYNLGVIATREGRYGEALQLYTQAAALAAGKANAATQRQILEALAAEQVRARDFAGLTNTLTSITALDPNDVDAQFRLAQAQVLAGQGALALPGTYAVLERQPGRVDAALLLADIYVGQNLPDRAIRELDAAAGRVANGSDRATLLIRKANIQAATGDSRTAVFTAQEATREDTRSASAFVRLAELRLVRQDRAGALSAYQKAVQLAPQNAAYRLALATLRLAVGQVADAGRDAAELVRLKPEPPCWRRRSLCRASRRSGRGSTPRRVPRCGRVPRARPPPTPTCGWASAPTP